GDVLRIIFGQPQRADLVGESKPPVVLHRPRGRRVRLGKRRWRWMLLEEDAGDAAAAELDREDEPRGPAADDRDLGSRHARLQPGGAASAPTAANSGSTDSRGRFLVMNTMRERRSSPGQASSVTGG